MESYCWLNKSKWLFYCSYSMIIIADILILEKQLTIDIICPQLKKSVHMSCQVKYIYLEWTSAQDLCFATVSGPGTWKVPWDMFFICVTQIWRFLALNPTGTWHYMWTAQNPVIGGKEFSESSLEPESCWQRPIQIRRRKEEQNVEVCRPSNVDKDQYRKRKKIIWSL